MLLTSGDRTTIIAALQFAAMAFDKKAKTDAAEYRSGDAAQAAAFSLECYRVAEVMTKG